MRARARRAAAAAARRTDARAAGARVSRGGDDRRAVGATHGQREAAVARAWRAARRETHALKQVIGQPG